MILLIFIMLNLSIFCLQIYWGKNNISRQTIVSQMSLERRIILLLLKNLLLFRFMLFLYISNGVKFSSFQFSVSHNLAFKWKSQLKVPAFNNLIPSWILHSYWLILYLLTTDSRQNQTLHRNENCVSHNR